MRHLLVFLVLTMFPAISWSQECDLSLEGLVIDYHDQTPLEGAVLEVTARGRYAQTDLEGRFKIGDLCAGVYELQISHPECRTVFQTFEIRKDTTVRILLEHHIEELEEVRVYGESDPNEVRSLAEGALDREVLEKFSSASLGDALKGISGVSSVNTGATIVKPVIQGLYGSRILIMNNNVRLQDMEWGDDHAPNIDLNNADQVRVIKGASALKYGGDALGGVILIEKDRILLQDSLWGSSLLSLNSNGWGGSLTSELTKSWESGYFLHGQASYRRLGDLRAPDYVLSNTGNEQIGLNFEAGNRNFESGWTVSYSFYQATLGILRASHIGNIDDLIRSINNRTPEVIEPFTYQIKEPRQEVTHHLGKAYYFQRFEGLGKLEFQYDFQLNRRFEFDVNRTQSDLGRPSIDLRLTTHSLTGSLRVDKFSDLILETGILARYQDNFADPRTGVRRLIPDYQRFEAGIFASAEWKISQTVFADAGMRYDFSRIDAQKFYRTSRWIERGYDQDFADWVVEDLGTQLLTNPVYNFNNLSATAGVSWKPVTKWDFSGNLSMSQRAPNPSELFSEGLHHSAARIELGDLRIGKEQSYKASLNVSFSSNNWLIEATPYYNRIRDYILLEPTGAEFTIRGAFPVWSYRQTDALIRGIDLSAKGPWTSFLSSSHQFSIVKGTDLDQDIALINMPAANFRNSVTYTKESWHGFRFGLESNYVFRQNEFPPNIEVFSPEQGQEVELEINTPPPAYHLLGMNARMKFEMASARTLEISVLAQNLLNERYRDYLDRLRYFADSPGQNWILNIKYNY